MRWGHKLGEAALADSIFTDGLTDPVLKIGMGATAEKIAEVFKISRDEQDRFALLSQQRAAKAGAAFARELVSIQTAEGRVEKDEAFAAQTLACARELKLSEAQLNLRGSAIAQGHPIGCSGARVLVTLLHILEDLDLKRGIAALCIGGGMGIATAIEREP